MTMPLNNLKFTVFGESHGPMIGVTIEGLPYGEHIDMNELKEFLKRRNSLACAFSTPRIEPDTVRFISGVKDNYTTGAPLTAVIENTNVHSGDYNDFDVCPRPSHADYVAKEKFGGYNDFNGGGHFSGRLTAAFCIIGAIAKQILTRCNVNVGAYVSSIGDIDLSSYLISMPSYENIKKSYESRYHILNEEKKDVLDSYMDSVIKAGDSAGGVVEALCYNSPVGLGGYWCDSLESRLSMLLYAIPAVKGVEFGSGFRLSRMLGSMANDKIYMLDNKVCQDGKSGGINGGISNGMPITLRVAIRPTPSIALEQDTVNLNTRENVKLEIKGRHDACIAIRAAVVVEAAMALGILDAMIDLKKEKFNA